MNRLPLTISTASLVYCLTAFYLFSLVLEGPLRFGLNKLGLYPLIYLPKFLLLLAIPTLLAMQLRVSKRFLLYVAILTFSLLLGLVGLSNKFQPLFEIWVLTPLIFALFLGRHITADPVAYRRLFLLLFTITAIGVLLNPLMNYPWSGERLDFGGTSIEISRHWSSMGVERHAGFARASFSAAVQLLVFSTWLAVTFSSGWTSLLIWAIAGAGILLTTSKGVMGAYLILSFYFLSGKILHHNKLWRRLWVFALSGAAMVITAIPLSTQFIKYNLKFDSKWDIFLFASFGDRLINTWPKSFALLGNGWQWLVGRGVGGLGVAQKYFELTKFMPGDNLFVYLVINFGIVAAITLLIILIFRASYFLSRGGGGNLIFPLTLFVMSYGCVANVFEGPLLGFLLGIILSFPTKCLGQSTYLSKFSFLDSRPPSWLRSQLIWIATIGSAELPPDKP